MGMYQDDERYLDHMLENWDFINEYEVLLTDVDPIKQAYRAIVMGYLDRVMPQAALANAWMYAQLEDSAISLAGEAAAHQLVLFYGLPVDELVPPVTLINDNSLAEHGEPLVAPLHGLIRRYPEIHNPRG